LARGCRFYIKIVPQRGEEKRFEPQRAQRAQREECWEGFGLGL
jgi:hypothetical protein